MDDPNFTPIRDGRGRMLLEREVPHGATDHRAVRQRVLQEMENIKGSLERIETTMDAVADLPAAPEGSPVAPSLFNKLVSLFQRRKGDVNAKRTASVSDDRGRAGETKASPNQE